MFSTDFESEYGHLEFIRDAFDVLLSAKAHLAINIIFQRHQLPHEIERAIMEFAIDKSIVQHLWSNIIQKCFLTTVSLISRMSFFIRCLPSPLRPFFVKGMLTGERYYNFHGREDPLRDFMSLQLPLLAMHSYSAVVLRIQELYKAGGPTQMPLADVADALKWLAMDGGIFHAFYAENQTPERADLLLKSACNAWSMFGMHYRHFGREVASGPSVFLVWAERVRCCLDWARQHAPGSSELVEELHSNLRKLHTDVCDTKYYCGCVPS
jgi:hypothetical protein